jgi:membrane protein implicated in regulation of membrane protease activity
MEGDFKSRIGTFFIVLGLGLLIIFIASAFSGQMQLKYFLYSALAFAFGSFLRRRIQHTDSGRFGSLRRLREQARKRREAGEQGQGEQKGGKKE